MFIGEVLLGGAGEGVQRHNSRENFKFSILLKIHSSLRKL